MYHGRKYYIFVSCILREISREEGITLPVLNKNLDKRRRHILQFLIFFRPRINNISLIKGGLFRSLIKISSKTVIHMEKRKKIRINLNIRRRNAPIDKFDVNKNI